MAIAGYVFDAYGTLFDVHSAVKRNAEPLAGKAEPISQLWRTKQLEYAFVRSLMRSYSDFWTLTEEALDFALASHDIKDIDLRNKLLDAYWTLDCYPEVASTLAEMRANGQRTAILTNGSPDMIRSAIEHAGLTELIDDVFSVDAVKVFKTAPEAYAMVTDSWDVKPKEICFFSSNRWDIAGASRFGFRTIWINRLGQPEEYGRYSPEQVASSLEAISVE